MLALTALFGPAWAGETVVHADLDAEAARARAAAVARVEPSTLDAVALQTLTARVPVGLGGARVLPCTESPTRVSDVEAHLKEATGAYLYMESDKALTELALAASALGCLADPLEPDLGARVWYLRGLVHFAAQDSTAAEAAFYRARVFVLDLAWDDDFAPDARPLFDRTAVQLRVAEPAWLEIVPAPRPGELRVDGKRVEAPEGRLALPSGPHFLQLGAAQPITLSVDLKSDGTLVVPSLLPPDTLSWAADRQRRPALSSTLAATLQRDTPVYIVDSDGVWRVRAGRDDWAELAPPKAAPPPQKPRRVLTPEERRKVSGRWMAVAGGVVAAAGGTYAGINAAEAWRAYDAGTNADVWSEYLAAEAEYTPARDRMLVGDIVAAGGLALTGVGIALAW